MIVNKYDNAIGQSNMPYYVTGDMTLRMNDKTQTQHKTTAWNIIMILANISCILQTFLQSI